MSPESLVAESWSRDDPTLYGRFDFVYDGAGPAKLLEYNADTPTGLFESAVVQWQWLRDLVDRGALPESADQFSSLHERLIARDGADALHRTAVESHRLQQGISGALVGSRPRASESAADQFRR